MNRFPRTAVVLGLVLSLKAADLPHVGDTVPVGKDIRAVGGIEVDLAPVHRWLLHPDGERPLKNWKQIHVLQFKGAVAGMERCVIKHENGEDAEVLISNLPTGLKGFLTTASQQRSSVAALRSRIALDERGLRETDAAMSGRMSAYVRPSRMLRSRAIGQAFRLKRSKEQLAQLETLNAVLLIRGVEQTTVLAMFTGRIYSNFEIWDCGRSRRNLRPV